MSSAYCSEPCTHVRCGAAPDEDEAEAINVVTLSLTDDEMTAIYDWIREGDSPKTIGHVCDVLKRILGGG